MIAGSYYLGETPKLKKPGPRAMWPSSSVSGAALMKA